MRPARLGIDLSRPKRDLPGQASICLARKATRPVRHRSVSPKMRLARLGINICLAQNATCPVRQPDIRRMQPRCHHGGRQKKHSRRPLHGDVCKVESIHAVLSLCCVSAGTGARQVTVDIHVRPLAALRLVHRFQDDLARACRSQCSVEFARELRQGSSILHDSSARLDGLAPAGGSRCGLICCKPHLCTAREQRV
jgi:hypothetical protein